MWLICALLAALGWGIADVLYKKGALESEKYTHLKTCIFIGISLGIQAIIILLTQDVGFNFLNIIYYLPVSMFYFLSMVLVFFGLKYIEVSIASPIENTYGGISAVLCFLFLGQRMGLISVIGVILITIGVTASAFFRTHEESVTEKKVSKKLTIFAFSLSIVYALLNALGVFFDAMYLDLSKTILLDVNEANIENVVAVAYGLTYMIVAAILYIYIKIRGDKLNIPKQKFKISAAICEALSQLAYIYAVAGNPIVVGPIVSSYCIVAVLTARIALKEKLSLKQSISIIGVIIGIIMISIAESL